MEEQEEQEEQQFPLVRNASLSSSDEDCICFSCRDSVGTRRSDLRLGCRCLVHHNCLISYLKSIINDRMTTSALDITQKGIHCPNYNKNTSHNECQASIEGGYFMQVKDLIRIVEISTVEQQQPLRPNEGEIETFTEADLTKLRSWLEEPTAENEEVKDVIIENSTKPCPKCKFRQSHFHGHNCHSVVCGVCHTGRCYRCGKENCLCGSSHSNCKDLRSYADIMDFVVMKPYPYDKRCGCAICFDCRPKKPCGTCSGQCSVCLGYTNPGPEEIGEGKEWEIFTPEMKAKALQYDIDHPVRRLNPTMQKFFEAVRGNRPEEVKLMRNDSLNIDISASDPRDLNQTVLHIAFGLGHIEMVEYLLEAGASINALDELELTPIESAVMGEQKELLNTLITKRPQLSHLLSTVMTRSGFNLLFLVCHFELKESVEHICQLAKLSASSNDPKACGYELMHKALDQSENGILQIAGLLNDESILFTLLESYPDLLSDMMPTPEAPRQIADSHFDEHLPRRRISLNEYFHDLILKDRAGVVNGVMDKYKDTVSYIVYLSAVCSSSSSLQAPLRPTETARSALRGCLGGFHTGVRRPGLM